MRLKKGWTEEERIRKRIKKSTDEMEERIGLREKMKAEKEVRRWMRRRKEREE